MATDAQIRPSRFSLGTLVVQLGVWLLCGLTLFPVAFIVVSSLKTNTEINRVLTLPAAPSFANYLRVLESPLFFRGTLNSLLVTLGALAIGVTLSALAGYAVGRQRGPLFVLIYGMFVVSLMIPTGSNLATLYLLMKNLGLLDSLLGLIVVYATGIIPFGVLLYAGFIKTIPVELDEAATIDGCGYYLRFWLVILPLLRPAIITHIVLSSVSIWNDFLMPFLLITSDEYKTLPLAVYSFQSNRVTDYGAIFAMLTIAVIPPTIFFLLTQRYFYNTVDSAVKG
jgi:raffinose/stachyose/melibiose transport system permease protein